MTALEFKFSSDQQHQLEAIEATCNLFRGQQFAGSSFMLNQADYGQDKLFSDGMLPGGQAELFDTIGHGNELRVAPGQLLDNLHAV